MTDSLFAHLLIVFSAVLAVILAGLGWLLLLAWLFSAVSPWASVALVAVTSAAIVAWAIVSAE